MNETKCAVARWCRFLQVSKSDYYSFVTQYEQREEEKASLMVEIKRIFDKSGGTYGLDRICGVLRRGGQKALYGFRIVGFL